MKLLLSRFFAIAFCTSIFGIFQELMKGTTLMVFSFFQAMLIVPLYVPLLLFQFFPFMLFATLLLVLSEIYSCNELVSLKTTGISNMKIMRVFLLFGGAVCLFFIFLSFLYPFTTKQFYKQKNRIGTANLLKTLSPNKINRFGKYGIFFTDIDSKNVLHNVSIIKNDDGNRAQQDGEGNKDNRRIIFAKSLMLGNNDFNETIGRGFDVDIVRIGFSNDENGKILTNRVVEATDGQTNDKFGDTKTKDEKEEVFNKGIVVSREMDGLFDEFFNVDRNFNVNYKNSLRQTSLKKLLSFKNINNDYERLQISFETHSRVVIYWFIVFGLIAVFGLLMQRTANRISSKKTLIVATIFGANLALSRAFMLEVAIKKGFLLYYYAIFILLFAVFMFILVKSDKKTTKEDKS